MPNLANVQSVAPARPAVVTPFSIVKAVRSIQVDDVRNAPVPSITYCQLNHIPYQMQHAVAQALSGCYNLFASSRDVLSRRESVALNRTMKWMGPRSAHRLGARLLSILLYAGGVHAGLMEMLKSSPTDPALTRARKQLESAIVRLGVRVGRCPTAPTGAYCGDKMTSKLVDARNDLADCYLKLVMKLDTQELFGGITRSIVAPSILRAVADRAAHRLQAANGDLSAQPVDVLSLLEWQYVDLTEARIERFMELGQADEAVYELLKLGEYVKWERQAPPADASTQASAAN